MESLFVMYRRSMLGVMHDPTAIVVAVVLTALEEAFLRSTMVYRDNLFRKLMGLPERSDAELAYQRKIWWVHVGFVCRKRSGGKVHSPSRPLHFLAQNKRAASAAMGMYIEFVAIITSRVMYLAFRQHRFVVNLGYGFDSNDSAMTTLTVLVTSAFLELVFEGIVDALALDIEFRNGVNVDSFWIMWEANPVAFWGMTLADGMVAVFLCICTSLRPRGQRGERSEEHPTLMQLFSATDAFKQVPTVAFCNSSTDACLCAGGGFEIYDQFCNATGIGAIGNDTSAGGNTTTGAAARNALQQAKNEYSSIFDSLAGQTTTILVSVGVAVLIVVVFTFSRVYLAYIQAGDARALAVAAAAREREENLRLKEELKAAQLDKEQLAMVKANAGDVEENVPPHFKLDWKVLKFLKRLGAGSFGDCYQGKKGERDVAIKRMRVALTDKKGFKAFCKEVVMLSSLDHINIVTLIGYVLEPCLLIVMDYVSGGTLSEFIEAQDPSSPPSMMTVMKIITGSAKGLEYLHAMEPLPVLHRDIKSDNILLTEKLEPRIADLGEARTMAKDHAMTRVRVLFFLTASIQPLHDTLTSLPILFARNRLAPMDTPRPRY